MFLSSIDQQHLGELSQYPCFMVCFFKQTLSYVIVHILLNLQEYSDTIEEDLGNRITGGHSTDAAYG